MSAQGQKLRKTKIEKYEQRVTCSKIKSCGSYGQLPAVRMNVIKGCWSLSEIKSEKRLLSCSRWNVHRKSWMKVSLTKVGERVTSACSCRRVSVQWCSVQHQRWASAILVRTSAIPQYCGLQNRLRNCGQKNCGTMIADLQNLTSAIPQLSAVSGKVLTL